VRRSSPAPSSAAITASSSTVAPIAAKSFETSAPTPFAIASDSLIMLSPPLTPLFWTSIRAGNTATVLIRTL
jgi:hypothetical protein